ncbi:hypothetical protein N0V84_001888 [Fusarium piperis]|uniref:F-box domain-containing protein n=1 Tax=Fusarium piperis TaxID=1435070 RepID=A0A9W8WKB7_9HYPO|nr:hypothetical protein N0V84_001888 [Fusarium piperis]
MPDFDCYCAICGVVLNDSPEIGSRDHAAVVRREERLHRKLEGFLDSDDESSYDHWEEDHQYDPDLVSRESLGWLGQISCIGLNANAYALEEDRTFFADAEPYDDYFKIQTSRKRQTLNGRSSNQGFDAMLTALSYSEASGTRPTVFPFHKVCYEMFERAVAFTNSSPSVDGNLLYHVMAGLSGNFLTHLKIDYGPMSGMDHFWVSKPGEEFTVTNPNDVDDFYQCLREDLEWGSFQISLEETRLGPANPDNDPFSKLSNELIREISILVPYDTLRFLRRASRPFYHDTLSNTFWKSRIDSDMPWLWDLARLGEISTTQIDYMKLYSWLEYVTMPEFGVQPPFLAIANRRRIWQPCMKLVRHYNEVRMPQYETEPEPKIVEQAQLRTLFKVAPIQAPTRGRTVRTIRLRVSSMIWLHSWGELEKCRFGGFFIESFWNEGGHLVGLGVVFGSNRRILGAETGEKHALHLRSGNRIFLGRSGHDEDVRLLCTSEDKFLVGVEGHIRSDGVITRIGILEAPIPEAKPCRYWNKPGPLAQRLLWAPSAWRMWEHRRLKITPVFPLGLTETLLEDSLNPYQILPWAEKRLELTKLARVSAYTPGNVADATEKPILGLMSEFVEGEDWQRKRHIGDGENWPEHKMAHLELDGPGGETIVEIGVPKSEVLSGLMPQGTGGWFGFQKDTTSKASQQPLRTTAAPVPRDPCLLF